MRWLTRVRPGESNDQGAIAAIVAILFMSGLMLGFAALTVDVGNINADRRQLQNGADAVALAVAQQCVQAGTCSPSDPNLGTLANANAATSVNGASEIRRVDGQTPAVCGNGPGLAACPSSSAPDTKNLQECPLAILPSGAKYVRVYTETKNKATGNNILPYSFGAAITGVGSGANQQTCAAAAWGPPSGGSPTIPVTISACEWNNLTATGTSLVAPGPYNDPFQSPDLFPGILYPSPGPSVYEKAILLHDTTGSTHCPAGPSGADLPGGFGWLATSSGCSVAVSATGWVNDAPGNSPPGGCNLAPYVGQTAYIPIFANTNALTGANGQYRLDGFAAFYLTGYSIPSDRPKSIATNVKLCTASQTCLYGWFTSGVIPRGSFGGGGSGTPRGAIAVAVVG